jgi:hypothetical protein
MGVFSLLVNFYISDTIDIWHQKREVSHGTKERNYP